MKRNVLKWVNTFALAAMLIVNALANILPIGIGYTWEIADKYARMPMPAST